MTVHLKPIVRAEFVTVRTHGRVMRNVLRELMVDHLEHRLPGHFSKGAERKYHYRNRTAKYLKRKRRLKGHDIPLVFTGRTRRDLMASKHRITATQHRSRLYFKNHFPLKNDQRNEIEIVLQYEQRDMARFTRRRYAEECRKPENKAKRKGRNRP